MLQEKKFVHTLKLPNSCSNFGILLVEERELLRTVNSKSIRNLRRNR